MDKLIQAMKVAFASEFNFYLRTHACHWNVQGPDFKQYHDLFGAIYEEVYGSIDDFAENIRKLDSIVDVDNINQRSMVNLPDMEDNLADPAMMIQMLLGDNDKLVKLFGMVYKIAEANGEFGLANFLADRQDAHRKHGWMMRASIKGTAGGM
jgi:starvation-inducible DNA-binding protein